MHNGFSCRATVMNHDVRPSARPSGTSVHCDHTVLVSADFVVVG